MITPVSFIASGTNSRASCSIPVLYGGSRNAMSKRCEFSLEVSFYRFKRFFCIVNKACRLCASAQSLNTHLSRACKKVKKVSALGFKLYNRKNSLFNSVGCWSYIFTLKGFESSASCGACNNSHKTHAAFPPAKS